MINVSRQGSDMKVSKRATIGSILLGVLFLIFGIATMFHIGELGDFYGLHVDCIMSVGIVVILWGITMIFFGYLQLKDIQKGIDHEIPDKIAY